MSPTKRPPPPAEAVSKRSVADAVGRRLREEIHPPEKPFGEEHVEEVEHVLRRVAHHEGPCELGVYNEDEDQSGPTRLGGKPRAIAFDEVFRRFFEKLTPDFRDNIVWLAREIDSDDRKAAFKELMARQVRRQVLGGIIDSLKKTVVISFLTGAAVIAWTTDQVSHFVDKWPAIKSFFAIFSGGRN